MSYLERQIRANPRVYALDMVAEGLVSADDMLLWTLNSMSYDDVLWMLENNDLMPEEVEDDDCEEED